MTSSQPITHRHWTLAAGLGIALLTVPGQAEPPAKPQAVQTVIDFNRDIRPILADNCFKCHGPDEKERKAKLRLGTRAGAVAELPGGNIAVVPSKPEASALMERITAAETTKRMPPAKTGKKLTPQQIASLRQWIAEGAKYSQHWAFIKPERPPVPTFSREPTASAWPRNDIDAFILARLQKEGLKPSPEADKITLIRRVTLDLTGLPPTPAEVDTFLKDDRSDAYERLVDRLLQSPRYGERIALEWLDAARYADTHGYHIDSGRDMTRWREWVIDAFNKNLPFDQFTIQQLAGDLLPNATLEQKIASGFNRNHMINFEGGAIPQEYHTAYIVDRVNTTATVWLGLTVGCAQCHDHKYDPITQKEFYQLYAFFHNVPENGLDGSKGNAAPLLKTATAEQQLRLDRLTASIKEAERHLVAALTVPPVRGLAQSTQAHQQLTKLRKERDDLDKQIPSTMVMQEMPQPRETFLLIRGQYDKKGEKVTAGVPSFLPPLRPAPSPPTPLPQGERGEEKGVPRPLGERGRGEGDGPLNRLDLARWLVDPEHPLTARVIVNRYWQMYFGTGLVKTAEDFGIQGDPPSHPELLDWLATEFIRTGWDVRRMQRLIVTSATYRQASTATPELLAKDPENRLLARQSRLRLQAEFIRDQALAVSGLLNGEIGGASVFPYQPKGLWEELMSRADGANWTAQTYTPSKGKDLYRRTMYTFWKRTCPPPTLATFDAPDRETCTVRRARTNTPLQALILMNDPTYIESARKLAERMLTEAGPTPEARLTFAFRLAVSRSPRPEEVAVLKKVLDTQLAAFAKDEAAALKLLSVGEAKRNEKLSPAELAAYAMVANVILNLDETVTRG